MKICTDLQELYDLGARKIIVFELAPIGCYPKVVQSVKPKTKCADEVNNIVSIFNSLLDAKVKELGYTLNGTTFVVAKTYQLIYHMIQNPSVYGNHKHTLP